MNKSSRVKLPSAAPIRLYAKRQQEVNLVSHPTWIYNEGIRIQTFRIKRCGRMVVKNVWQ